MGNINKIETELATKLGELGFETKHGDGQIGYEHEEIGLSGRIGVFSDEITCSLNLDVVGGYLPLLQLNSFNCSKVEEIVFLHSAVVEYLKELKKSSIDFCALVQSAGVTAIDKDVVDKYVFHGKLYLKRFTGETDETSVWNTLDSEKEMIKFLEELVRNLIDMQRYMIRKGMYGD